MTDGIDAFLGYDPEKICTSVSFLGREGDGGEEIFGCVDMIDPNVAALSSSPDDGSTLPQQTQVGKPGQLPSTSVGKVEPLRKAVLKSVLTNTLDAYTSMSEEDKYLVSELTLQLQDVLTNSHDSSTVTNKSGLSVVVPSGSCLLMQPKNRLAPSHESKKRKTKLSSQSSVVSVAHEVVCNSKKRRITCSFCERDHRITACDRKQRFRINATEYVLTTDDLIVPKELRIRLKEMPAIEGCGKGSPPFESIANVYLPLNFIIHEARSIGTNSRLWCISFIGKDGEVMKTDLTERIWITYDAMNCLVTHKNKVKKYVYDETIISQKAQH